MTPPKIKPMPDADLRDHRAAMLRDPDIHALHEFAKAHLDAIGAIQERYGPLSTTIAYLIRAGHLVPPRSVPDPPPEGIDPAFGRQWLRAEKYLAAICRAKALLDDPDATVDRETVRAALSIPITDEDRAEWAQSGLDVLHARALAALTNEAPPMTARREPPMPDSMKVGPLTYAITADSMAHKLAEHRAKTGLYGRCEHEKQTIYLNPDVEAGQFRATLLHETLHAVISSSGIEIGHDDEERIVAAVEMPLLGVFRDNPEWVAFLVGGNA